MTGAPAAARERGRELCDGIRQRRTLRGREELLQTADLLLRADADQHVARVEHLVRAGRGDESAGAAPDGDDHRAGGVADVEIPKRMADRLARRLDRDLLEPQLVAAAAVDTMSR